VPSSASCTRWSFQILSYSVVGLDMSVSSKMILCERSARLRAQSKGQSARHQRPRLSADVAEVAKRPKKRPGRRERSSITIGATRRQAELV
jgi:hypothetical protein